MIVLVALAAAGPVEFGLGAQVGESCLKDPTFVVKSVDVNPFPIVRTEQYLVNMTGTFSTKEYVEQIYIASKLDKGFWHYDYQTVNKEYAKGTTTSFLVSIQGPSDRGSYIVQMSVHRHDFSVLACWQYDFTI